MMTTSLIKESFQNFPIRWYVTCTAWPHQRLINIKIIICVPSIILLVNKEIENARNFIFTYKKSHWLLFSLNWTNLFKSNISLCNFIMVNNLSIFKKIFFIVWTIKIKVSSYFIFLFWWYLYLNIWFVIKIPILFSLLTKKTLRDLGVLELIPFFSVK